MNKSRLYTPEQIAAIRKIQRLMDFWQVELGELGAPLPARVAVAPPPPPTPHRYRHPLLGLTWEGVGPQPTWLKEALTKEGYTVSELREAPPTASCED